MAKMYYEKDCDINYLNGKKIAIIGYGSQGHAHALNLKDSGCDVCVGLRAGSKNWKNAEDAGLKVMTVADAAKWGDIVMMLINDEVQADVYRKDIAPYMTEGKALAFAHGFNIRYQQIVPPAGVDVFMAAPKGPGHTVRSQYVAGKGVPCLVAVEQNATGNAYKIALAYIAGIGGARAGVMERNIHELAAGVALYHSVQLQEGMAPLPVVGEELAKKYLGGGFGGYALYLFASREDRDAAVCLHGGMRAVEPFCKSPF